MKIRREDYDIYRRAVMMILRHFDERFAWRDGEDHPPDFIVWNVKDFDLIRRAGFMIVRHLEKLSGWRKANDTTHP